MPHLFAFSPANPYAVSPLFEPRSEVVHEGTFRKGCLEFPKGTPMENADARLADAHHFCYLRQVEPLGIQAIEVPHNQLFLWIQTPQGIGNAMLQVSLNPLLQNVVTDEKLLTSSLTAGQVVKAVSSFVGPFIVLAAVNLFGQGDEGKWYYCFPIMGAITLISGLWLLATPIARERQPKTNVTVQQTFGLLKDPTILLLFFGIFFAVGTDVSTNFISSKVMISRFGYTKEMAGIAPQVYFISRTIGAFLGVFFMTKIAEMRYFRINIIGCLLFALGLAFIGNDVADFVCIGGIGFCCSCVFPIIYGMALKSRPDKANEISGLMIMAVAGGTMSFLVGAANDSVGVTGGVLVVACEIVYLTYCAFFLKTK